MTASFFINCDNCGSVWKTRADFLVDKDVVMVGYQANFNELEKGLFLFNHSCHTTLPIEVHVFADMYAGPIFEKRLLDSDSCAGYCLHRQVLNACPNQCECAYVREIMQRLGGPFLGKA